MTDYIETWDHKLTERDRRINEMIVKHNEKMRKYDEAYRKGRITKLQETIDKLNDEIEKDLASRGLTEKDIFLEIPVPKYQVLPRSCCYKGGLFDGDID